MAKFVRPATDAGISIGQVYLGKYRVEEILGQGGMGIVARCTHLTLGEQVAIKMLRPDVMLDEDAKSRFMREAQAAVKLRSEYVAHVYDVGTLETSVPYMVMEFLDGQDLGQLLEDQKQINPQWAVELMLQAAEALAEAHSLNIVHRDVKPTNLFVTWRPDNTSLIKVLDFGISKSPMGTDMQLTQTQSLLGTPAYMSPEQMRSARLVDGRSDIWSLGTVMYELIEGRRPFEADSFSEMCVKVAVDAPLPMRNAPPGLEDVVMRCLAKSPDQRYANMAELGRDLIPFARDPNQATMLVDRMFRMVGRSTGGNWEGTSTGSGIRALRSTPMPIRAQSPVAAWSGKSDPAGTPLADSVVAPKALPIDPSSMRRGRWGIVIGLLVGAIAIGAGLAFWYVGRDETATPAAAAQPVDTTPATGSAPALEPAGSNAPEQGAKTVDVAKEPVAEDKAAVEPDDVKSEEIEIEPTPAPPTVSKKTPKKTPKKTSKPDKVAKQPPPPSVEKKDEKKDDKPLMEPTKPRPMTLEEMYSKPRPDRPK